jgi:hypothetical protein
VSERRALRFLFFACEAIAIGFPVIGILIWASGNDLFIDANRILAPIVLAGFGMSLLLLPVVSFLLRKSDPKLARAGVISFGIAVAVEFLAFVGLI